ncbi:MAG: hypothetical protein PHS73_01305 [Candidatus Peribacteraceae bacterium]|nr:hypothetical protein [Candidatus Peribacteraceae bacterium]
MLFVETLGPEHLPILLKQQPETPVGDQTLSTLYQNDEDPTARIHDRVELLIDHLQEVEQDRKKRHVPRAIIRDRIHRALALGTITMDVTPENTVARTSFARRELSHMERVFGVFMSDVPTGGKQAR